MLKYLSEHSSILAFAQQTFQHATCKLPVKVLISVLNILLRNLTELVD